MDTAWTDECCGTSQIRTMMRNCNAMKKIIPIIILTIAVCCGCQKEQPADDGNLAVELLSTRAPGGSSSDDYRPVFLFYRTDAVVNIPVSPYPDPYYVADNVPEDANAYENIRYNTRYAYPTDFSTLLATGYIPNNLQPVIIGETKHYHELTLPTSGKGPGRVDLMAPEKPLTGSLLNPFEKAGPLTFKHLQSKLTFRAICNNNFPTTLYVDNVIITIQKRDLAGGIQWDVNHRTYQTKNSSVSDIKIGHGYEDLSGNVINVDVLRWYDSSLVIGSTDNNDYSDIGGVYVTPNRYNIRVNISCRMYPADSLLTEAEKDQYTKTADDLLITFKDGSSDIQLVEGDCHEITLFFEQDGVDFSGRKAAWEQGGNIVIPVVPSI